MDTRTLRFLKTVAGTYEARPGIFDAYGFHEGEVVEVPATLASALPSRVAEPVKPSRTAEVERATREPRSEQAIAFKRRGRR